MLRLKQIKNNNGIINCQLFPEDSVLAGSLNYNKNTDEIISFIMPDGYEWCEGCIAQALQFFRNNENLPEEETLIWF